MERRPRSKLNAQVYEEACEWFVECRSGDLTDTARCEFDRWLRRSPEYLSAYLEIAAIWNEGPSLDPTHKWDAAAIAAAARGEDIVVPLLDSSRGRTSLDVPVPVVAKPSVHSSQWRLLGVAASVIVLGLVVLIGLWLARMPTYSTGVGEQRSVVLSDGSTLELNSRSKIKIHYSKGERAMELLEGQALFRVAKDPSRPFVVTSGETRVRAVGTQFDVYKKRSGTVVTVLEGRVAILTEEETTVRSSNGLGANDPAQSTLGTGILLSRGEQATVARDVAHKAQLPDVEAATAWTQRQLVFESAPLDDVAEEFNRYNTRQLIIESAGLRRLRISGVFSSTDPASLIRFLRQLPGVQVLESESEIRVSKKNSLSG